MSDFALMILSTFAFAGGTALIFIILFWVFKKVSNLNIGVPGDHGGIFDPNKK
jgi:hypothetical protein